MRSLPAARSTIQSAPNTVSPSPAAPALDSLPTAARDSTIAAPASTATETPRVSASVADSRTVARQFVTLLNQRRWSEVEQLASLGGDATLRTELVRLVHSAPDFAAGFESVASAPQVSADGFTTEFVLALEWRGGKKLVTVRLRAVAQLGQWRLAAFGTTSAA